MKKDIKYPMWAKAEKIRSVRAEEERRTRQREEYLKQKEEYENSKQGKFEASVRKVVQDVSKVEQDAYLRIFEATRNLSDQTVEIIKDMVEEEKTVLGYVKIETAKYALNQTDMAINKIKKVCAMPEYQARLHKGAFSDLEKFYNALIDVNITFALFAPARCLNRKSLKYHRMSDDYKDLMFARLEEFGLIDNPEFLETYEKAFANQLAEKGVEV